MKGRQPGRSTKWVSASIEQVIDVNRSGIRFAVWRKWKKQGKRLGTLVVNNSGLRWLPPGAKTFRRKSWTEFEQWFRE